MRDRNVLRRALFQPCRRSGENLARPLEWIPKQSSQAFYTTPSKTLASEEDIKMSLVKMFYFELMV